MYILLRHDVLQMELQLSHNALKEVPCSLDDYWGGSLQRLNLSHNHLTELTQGLCRLGKDLLTNLVSKQIVIAQSGEKVLFCVKFLRDKQNEKNEYNRDRRLKL